MNCPTCTSKMDHEVGLAIVSSRSSLDEHHYRCDDCDATYVKAVGYRMRLVGCHRSTEEDLDRARFAGGRR